MYVIVKNRKGMTIVEVMVSMTIMGIVITSIALGFTQAKSEAVKDTFQVTLPGVIQEKMEELINMPFTNTAVNGLRITTLGPASFPALHSDYNFDFKCINTDIGVQKKVHLMWDVTGQGNTVTTPCTDETDCLYKVITLSAALDLDDTAACISTGTNVYPQMASPDPTAPLVGTNFREIFQLRMLKHK